MLIMVAEYSMLSSIIKFIFILIVFIALLFAASWFTKWYAGSGMLKNQRGNIKILETHSIGQGKVVQILQIGEKYIAVAQGKDTVTYLTELSEEELDFEPVNQLKTGGFQEMFAEMVKNKKKQQEK
ncbi:MAG: flagellar biosynthetic protein FliO [Lachnospiraceae bacterium]|nr:flagellar biosynthetic protein FliO [Lachnospiraceae bacterium]